MQNCSDKWISVYENEVVDKATGKSEAIPVDLTQMDDDEDSHHSVSPIKQEYEHFKIPKPHTKSHLVVCTTVPTTRHA